MAIECDVLVVGGGVSGSVAALSSLHHGVGSVLVVEKGRKIGENTSQKIDFAENTGIAKTIEELELPIRHYSNKSRWYPPSNACLTLESRIADCWVKRGPSDDSFEVMAMESAIKKGADVLVNAEFFGHKNNTVIIKVSGKTEEVKAKVVIDAMGLNSRLAKSSGIFGDVDASITRIIGQGVVGRNFDMEEGIPTVFFSNRLASGSYVLVFKDPTDGLGYIIQGFREGIETDRSQYFKKLLEENEILKDIMRDAEILRKIGGVLYITNSIPRSFSFDNILFAGDSARLMDPFLHYGVKPAIISGYLAGKVASGAISEGRALAEYDDMIKKALSPELKAQHRNRKLFDELSDNDIDRLFDFLIDIGERGTDFDSLFDDPYGQIPSILRALVKNPSTIPLSLKLILVKGFT